MNNRTTRILVAVITIPILLGLSYLGGILFLLFVLLIGIGSFYEFAELVKNKGDNVNQTIGVLSVAFLIVNVFYHFIGLQLIIFSSILLLLIFELFRNKGSAIHNIGSTLLGIFYIGLFSSSILGIREFYSNSLHYNNGGLIIISIFITLWATDSAAYFLGSAFGKHKLFPRVSPNKSWEGAIAGFIFAIVTMVVLNTILLSFISFTDALVIGIIIGLFGQIGDLIESLLKRDAGVKDSSNLIPGHGGVLDRFDSLFFSAPIIFLYIVYIM